MLQNEDETDGGGSFLTLKRDEIEKSSEDDNEKKSSNKRLKDAEISVPIVYGTMAFWLGKKASESQTHKWTVYVRGATNEDLGVVIKRVVFQLHPSFTNPVRVVESPPFELSERGWGEFEIVISIVFHGDVCDKQLSLLHHLKLYTEDEFCPLSMKKPIVVESYDEIVLADPSETFFARVQNNPAVTVPRHPATFELAPVRPVDEMKIVDTKDHFLNQWFMNFSDTDELLKLAEARQRVQSHISKLRIQMAMEGVPQPLEPACVS